MKIESDRGQIEITFTRRRYGGRQSFCWYHAKTSDGAEIVSESDAWPATTWPRSAIVFDLRASGINATIRPIDKNWARRMIKERRIFAISAADFQDIQCGAK